MEGIQKSVKCTRWEKNDAARPSDNKKVGYSCFLVYTFGSLKGVHFTFLNILPMQLYFGW
jgi:hypothetical protein